MMSNTLPAILLQPHNNSLSIERVLNKAIQVTERLAEYSATSLSTSELEFLYIHMEDLRTLLQAVERN